MKRKGQGLPGRGRGAMDRGAQERLVFKVMQTPDNATTATKQQPPRRARSAQHTPSTLFPCPGGRRGRQGRPWPGAWPGSRQGAWSPCASMRLWLPALALPLCMCDPGCLIITRGRRSCKQVYDIHGLLRLQYILCACKQLLVALSEK